MNNPEEWLNMLSTMEFTHNNRQHADWLHTPFELMLGITPVAIPATFEHTKYPSIEEKMKNLIKDQEEALAHICTIWKRTEGLARFQEFEDSVSQEDWCKGNCGVGLSQILAGGPKLIYYAK